MDTGPGNKDEEGTDYSRPSNVGGSGISSPIWTASNRQDLHGQGSGGNDQQTRAEHPLSKDRELRNSPKVARRTPEERQGSIQTTKRIRTNYPAPRRGGCHRPGTQ